MITRRSFLWQMFGAGIWTLLAKWFKGEPTVAEPVKVDVAVNYPCRGYKGWETFLFTREEWDEFWMREVREMGFHHMYSRDRFFWTDGGRVVGHPWTGQGHGLDWDTQPAEEDVKRMRQLLIDTGCPVNLRINYPCSAEESGDTHPTERS